MATIRKFKINDIEYPIGNIRFEADTLKNHLIRIFENDNLSGTVLTANVVDTELEGVVTIVQDRTIHNTPPPSSAVTKYFTIIKNGKMYVATLGRAFGLYSEPTIEETEAGMGLAQDVIIEKIKFVNNDGEYTRLYPYTQTAVLYIETNPISKSLINLIEKTGTVALVFYYPARSGGQRVESARNNFVFAHHYNNLEDPEEEEEFVEQLEKLMITITPDDLLVKENETRIAKSLSWPDLLKNNFLYLNGLRMPDEVFTHEFGDLDINERGLKHLGGGIIAEGVPLSDLKRVRPLLGSERWNKGFDYPRSANHIWMNEIADVDPREARLQQRFYPTDFTSSLFVGPEGVITVDRVGHLINLGSDQLHTVRSRLLNRTHRQWIAPAKLAVYWNEVVYPSHAYPAGSKSDYKRTLWTRAGIAIVNPNRFEAGEKIFIKKYSQCDRKISVRLKLAYNLADGAQPYIYLLTGRSIIHPRGLVKRT